MDSKSNNVLPLFARCVSDEDKIKLIDIIPGIENYVTSFNKTSSLDKDIGALLKRLPNLRKVVNKVVKKGRIYFMGFMADGHSLELLADINPRITEFSGFSWQAILGYIQRARERNRNYKASDIQQVFNEESRFVEYFLENYPNFELKLAIDLLNSIDEDKLVKNGRVHMTHDLRLLVGYALRSELDSVRKLTVEPTSYSTLWSNLGLLPNVEEVTLKPTTAEDTHALQSLLRIKNLRKLNLCAFYELTEENLKAFQLILMKSSLKQLEIKEHQDSEMKLVNAFLDCDRNDFESLKIQTYTLGNLKSNVTVENGTMIIHRPITFSLVTLFSKFKRIKVIKITTKRTEQIQNDIDVIVGTLPRNRSLRVQSGRDVFSY